MLKIGNDLIDLNVFANNHYEYLNKKCKSGKRKGEYYVSSIIYGLDNARQNSQTNTELLYYDFLLGINNSRIKTIITGTPLELNTLISQFELLFPNNIFYQQNPITHKTEETDIYKKTKAIFNYTTFRSSTFCKDYLTQLGFKNSIPCPYCNLDELRIINSGQDLQALLDLDHFIPQGKYPFLALSFFNLIPSCGVCNSRLKGEIVFNIDTHINPYDKSFEDTFKFSLKTPFVLNQNIDEFKFCYSQKINFPENSITDLKLIERYDTEKEDIFSDLTILVKNTSTKITEISNLFQNGETRNEIYQLAKIPLEKKNIINYKLGKLKRDLCIDLGLL